ncbi:TfoX/Sxy family protein [Mucilaginibacter mali]|uniref:TfoX/Sxy family protein n=1 Tax=Mucilaginibacter mali TaxID=2740462 RepID=A0A7D4UP66_9SPHI|nr:TfoX/Sxy family protein [Mucilaginibacter mali]QKJ32741.1 TfoX/Sxy family protein [Mucilaginibacter mali]
MPYDEKTVNQVREMIAERTDNVVEKVMFGGLCFMVEDKICIGVKKDTLLARIAPEVYDAEVEKDGRAPMIHGGKPVKTYLFVNLDTIHNYQDLAWWVKQCLDYNPIAPLSQAKQKAKAKSKD